jgi:hypothetical protein
MQNKSPFFEILNGKMLEHPRSLGVGSQFSLRWFFQHALAWKNHVLARICPWSYTSRFVEGVERERSISAA